MAEGTYEYECMRAELLGMDKPDLETFNKNHKKLQLEAETEEIELGEVNVRAFNSCAFV